MHLLRKRQHSPARQRQHTRNTHRSQELEVSSLFSMSGLREVHSFEDNAAALIQFLGCQAGPKVSIAIAEEL